MADKDKPVHITWGVLWAMRNEWPEWTVPQPAQYHDACNHMATYGARSIMLSHSNWYQKQIDAPYGVTLERYPLKSSFDGWEVTCKYCRKLEWDAIHPVRRDQLLELGLLKPLEE